MSQLCGSGLRSRSNVTSAARGLDDAATSAAQPKTAAMPVDFSKRLARKGVGRASIERMCFLQVPNIVDAYWAETKADIRARRNAPDRVSPASEYAVAASVARRRRGDAEPVRPGLQVGHDRWIELDAGR